MHEEAKYIIKKLNLTKLVEEGGYYRETYRSDKHILVNWPLDKTSKTDIYCYLENENDSCNTRSVCTLIYYLLPGDQFSAFHRVRYDEIWHFYKGSPISLYVLSKNKDIVKIHLGDDLRNGEQIQCVIKGNSWFAAEVDDKSLYSLIGCSVSPGFDFSDFELGNRGKLKKIYPQHKLIIDKLTRQ